MAKSYIQIYEINHQETLAPIVKMNIVHVLLSRATYINWQLQQFDVKNILLLGELQKKIYMKIPLGCVKETSINKMSKLSKALYRLMRSPRMWFDIFAKVMLGI